MATEANETFDVHAALEHIGPGLGNALPPWIRFALILVDTRDGEKTLGSNIGSEAMWLVLEHMLEHHNRGTAVQMTEMADEPPAERS